MNSTGFKHHNLVDFGQNGDVVGDKNAGFILKLSIFIAEYFLEKVTF